MAATFETLCEAIDLIDMPCSLLDLDGHIRHLNPANEQLLGRTTAELRGKPISVILPAELGSRTGPLLASLREHGKLQGFFPNVLPDGSTMSVDVNAEIVRSPEGEPRWILASVRDLSGQIGQLEQLNASALSLLTAPGDDLPVTIVRVARRLLGARYAALGIVEDGRLVAFIPDGMSEAEVAGIERWPAGEGLLGAMITERRTIRIPDIGADPRRVGFPPGHPPMRSFLGTPIWGAGEVHGHLYFTDKLDETEFNALDEHLVELFASHAAITIRDRRQSAALQASERNLAEAQQIAHIGSWERDLTTGTLSWSDESCRMFGIEPGTFAGTLEAFLAFVHPDDRAKAAPSRAVLEQGAPSEVDYRIIRPDGTMRIMHEVGHVIRDAAGRPVRFVGSTQDITEHVRLEAQQTRFARLLDEVASEIYIFDAETLRFTEVNAGARRNVGYSIDELHELTPLDLKPEFTLASFRRMIAPLPAGERSQVTFETIHRRKDGSTYPVEVRLHFLPSETPAVFVAIIQDITERMAAGEERARLVSAVEQTADPIIITDPSGTIVYVNAAFERVTGYTRDEVVGKNPRILKSGEHDAEFYRSMWTTLLDGRPWSGSVVNRRKDGGLYAAETTISPVLGAGGELTSFVEVGRDVTRERELESALARDARERDTIEAALAGIDPGSTPEEIAAVACAEISRLPHVDSAWVLGLEQDRGRILAAAGRLAEVLAPERPVPDAPVRYLLERAATGPWAEAWSLRAEDGAYGEAITAAGLQGAVYAPLRGAHGVVGVMAIGAHDRANADRIIERLPALATFGSIIGALLAPTIEARSREADARASIQEILDAQAFVPFFQPIVNLHDGAVVGYEALSRFADGSPADVVFATAARVGLAVELETATLQAALDAASLLPSGAYLSANASPELIGSTVLRPLLADLGRPFVVEITEHVVVDDYVALRRGLKSLGPTIRLAVDDAGAGYASLRHILELAPDFVKLDIGLVRGIDADPARQALVAGVGYFAVKRKMRLVAEGIETEAERETLRSLGVAFGQGFLLGPPLPADDLVGGAQPEL